MLNTKAQSFLTRSAHYLIGDKHARNFTHRANVSNWLQEFTLHLANVSAEPDKLLTVAVVGEFKAGKSTLINAMLGKEVAFVDAFEATTSVAVIKPGLKEMAVVEDSAGNRKVMSIEQFVNACRQFKMRDVNRLEMTVNHNLPLVVIDTPGMGSITTAHEERAEAAIMDSADLVLWVMDPSDMLSAKEGAFLKRARSINLPVWCIVSKVDELSAPEIDECIECIVRTTGLDRSDVLALSAHNHIESGSDPGVVELMKRLQHTTRHSADVRFQAEGAKVTELLDEFEHAIDLIGHCVKSEIDWLDGEHEIFSQEAQIVKATLLRDTKSFLAESAAAFFDEKLPALVNPLTSPEHICRILVESFSKERLPSVADRIALRVHEKAVAVWDESFEDRHSDLSRQIENLARNEMQDSDSEMFLRNQLVVTEERREAVKRGFSTVPAAVGAGALTLMLDPTGITANLVTMAIGALAGHFAGKSAEGVPIQTTTETRVQSHAVTDFARQMSDTIVDQLVASEVICYIDRVVQQALDERCRQRVFGMKECDIQSVHANLGRISYVLRGIRLSGDPGDDMPGGTSRDDAGNGSSAGEGQSSFAYEARVQLMRIVKEHGTDICQFPKRVEGLLKDMCGDCPKEVFLLTQCLSSGVIGRVMNLRNTVPEPTLILTAANELQKSREIGFEAARWAVKSWTEALRGIRCREGD